MRGRKISRQILEDSQVIELRDTLREIDQIERTGGMREIGHDRVTVLQRKATQLQRQIQGRGLNMTQVAAVVTSIDE